MGKYNADQTANLQQAQIIARDFNLLGNHPALTDQWTIDSAHRVSSFRDGTKRISVKVKYDPRSFPVENP